MLKPEIRLIMFFAAEEEEAIYSQQKQDLELTVTFATPYCKIQA